MRFRKHFLKTLHLLTVILLAAYCAWQIFLLLNMMFSLNDQDVLEPIESKLAVETNQYLMPLNINNIVNSGLFGEVKPIDKQQIEIPHSDVPETKLNVKLKGLRYGDGGIPSTAIIEGANSQQVVYQQGDTLIDNDDVTVYQINVQYLILKHKGRYEALTLFDVLEQNNRKKPAIITAVPSVVKEATSPSSKPINMWDRFR